MERAIEKERDRKGESEKQKRNEFKTKWEKRHLNQLSNGSYSPFLVELLRMCVTITRSNETFKHQQTNDSSNNSTYHKLCIWIICHDENYIESKSDTYEIWNIVTSYSVHVKSIEYRFVLLTYCLVVVVVVFFCCPNAHKVSTVFVSLTQLLDLMSNMIFIRSRFSLICMYKRCRGKKKL